MSALPSFQTQSGFGDVPTGFSGLAYLDPVEVDVIGNGYAAQVTDYAAVSAAGTSIVAETGLGGQPPTNTSHRFQTLQRFNNGDPNANGDLFIYGPQSVSNGLTITRFNSAGVSQGGVSPSSAASVMADPGYDFLSNGDVVTWYVDEANGNNVTFAIYDPFLNQVVAPTALGEAPNNTVGLNLQGKALAGGGFSLLYVKGSSNQVRLAIFDNTGTPVGASPFTILGLTGTAGAVMPRLEQTKAGSILALFTSAYATTIGTYFALLSAAGASQVGATQVDTSPQITATTAPFCEVSLLPGFFAFATARSANVKAWVYSDQGASSAQQGSTFTHATTMYGTFGGGSFKLSNDGTKFWLFDGTSAATILGTSITTGGVAGSTIDIISTQGSGNTSTIDAKLDRGNRLVILGSVPGGTGGTSKWFYCVFNPITLQVEVPRTPFGTAASSTGLGNKGGCLLVGDFAFLANYDVDQTHNFIIIKHTSTAFVGQGQKASANPAAGPTPVRTAPNIYPCNAMVGSPSKTFDHSAATPHGNKGTLSLNALSLEGY